jgi:hypothetical protein
MARSLNLRRRSKAAPPAPSKTSRNSAPAPEPELGRVERIRQVWTMTRERDPRVVPYVFGPMVAVIVVLVVVGLLLGMVITFAIISVPAAVITGTAIFGRRATKAGLAQVEGRPGAAAAILPGLRGDWRTTPAVGFTRNQDLVHRVVGRPGVILIGEGSPNALRPLITDQKRRIGRIAPDTPIYDIIIGDGEGQVPLAKLHRHMLKLPRNLKKAEVNAVEARMRALGTTNVPIPKGPMPTRMPRGKLR